MEIAYILPVKGKWVLAEEGIEDRRHNFKRQTNHTKGLITQVYNALASISWSDAIKGFPGTALTNCLAMYLTKDWLTDEHEDQMLCLLERELTRLGRRKDDKTHIANTFFITRLIEIYKDPNRTNHYATSEGLAWLRKKGQEFGTGVLEKLVTIANVGGNHWVAVEVDFECSKIIYGDSLGGKINQEIETALTWWIHQHTAKHFTTGLLPITQQKDDYSCGILAWNAIATKIIPENHSLMDNSQAILADELRG
jgi:Ulp1 family protease